MRQELAYVHPFMPFDRRSSCVFLAGPTGGRAKVDFMQFHEKMIWRHGHAIWRSISALHNVNWHFQVFFTLCEISCIFTTSPSFSVRCTLGKHEMLDQPRLGAKPHGRRVGRLACIALI